MEWYSGESVVDPLYMVRNFNQRDMFDFSTCANNWGLIVLPGSIYSSHIRSIMHICTYNPKWPGALSATTADVITPCKTYDLHNKINTLPRIICQLEASRTVLPLLILSFSIEKKWTLISKWKRDFQRTLFFSTENILRNEDQTGEIEIL